MVEEDEGILGESGPRWMLDDPPRASQATRSRKKRQIVKKATPMCDAEPL